MLAGSLILLAGAAGLVAIVHSVLPDHWVPLAVVARGQRWSLWRVGGISGLAAAGHVLASLVLAAAIALVGLRFQKEIDAQQGHIIGGILVLTGLGFLVWGLTGHGHAHGHDHPEHEPSHEHAHEAATTVTGEHAHQHAHAELIHSHPHSHGAYVENRARVIEDRSRQQTLAARLAMIAVPFGVAASPDLTILPVGLAASAYGAQAVALVLAVFAITTMAVFVGLTVVATAVGYQFEGEWLENHANTITSAVLIVIGVIAFAGF